MKYSVLQQQVFALGSSQVPLYNLLQHLSTLIGVVMLVVTYYSWVRRAGSARFLLFTPEDRWRYACVASVLALSAAIAIPLSLFAAHEVEGYEAVRMFVFRSAVYGAASFIVLLLLVAIGFMVIKRSNPTLSGRAVGGVAADKRR